MPNTTVTATATATIQAILAPAVMISSSALFLLGLNARYAAILSRIRSLSAEKRHLAEDLARCLAEQDHSKSYPETMHCRLEQTRLSNVVQQLTVLLQAAWCLRNSMLCHILAAIFFVLTSCAIALNFLAGSAVPSAIALDLFMTGMVLLLIGITFLGVGMFKSYPAILLEVYKG